MIPDEATALPAASAAPARTDVRALAVRVLHFAGVSGAGLCLDYLVYWLLCRSGVPAGWANAVSASCGVTFVFVASARRIFEADHHFQWPLFLPYAAYQAVAIAAASAAVGLLDDALDGKFLLAKLLVLPVTFTANFLFMSWLTRRRSPSRIVAGARG